MTTLTQTRAWMQAGCPLPEEPREPNWGCAGFVLRVWPLAWSMANGGGQAQIACQGCGQRINRQGQQPIAMIRVVRVWMVKHAVESGRLRLRDAVAAFGQGRDWNEVARVMLKGKAETYRGYLSFPGDGTEDLTVHLKTLAKRG